MFVHVVLMRFGPGADAEFHAQVQRHCARVRAECAGVLHYACVPNESARAQGFTHATIGLFVDSAAHDAYQVHPAHVAMKAAMTPMIEAIVVCDATLDATDAAQKL